MRAFAHRQRMQQQGLRRADVMQRPCIAVINTWSDLSPCHAHLRERAEAVKRGVLMAGGLPFELPALSLGEVMVKPTTMLYRNFLAMEVEELLRSLPIDGVVLLAGCDKTTPGTVMGAISMGLPTIFCSAGPMLNDRYLQAGQPERNVGAGTHTRLFWDEYQAGKVSDAEWIQLESHMTRSPGTCNTMGTASTMTLHRRSARPGVAGLDRDSGDGRGAHAHGHELRRAHRADGVGRHHAGKGPHARCVHECSGGADGARRLDQRRRASDRDGAARRRRIHARRSGQGRPRSAGAGQPVPERRPADGRLSLRRWAAGADDAHRCAPVARPSATSTARRWRRTSKACRCSTMR